MRARAVSVLLAVSALLALALAGAGSASAVPGLPDCKDAPVVYSPSDSALLQWLDPDTGSGAPAGGAFDATPPHVYYAYGYAGFQWSTYDLGCAGALSSFDSLNATADTATGNKLLGMAVAQTAMTNGIHARLGDVSQFMAPLDDVVADTTAALRDAVYTPWIGGALAVVVVLMLALASLGQLSQTVRAGAWALAVLTVTMGVLNYPVRAAQFFDQTVSGSVGAVNAAAAGITGPPDGTADVTRAQGALLVDRVLYDSWLRGEFGSTSGPAVEKYARTLWEAHTLSYAEAKTYHAGGDTAKALIESKNERWTRTMEQISNDDPSLYQQLQGKKGGRIGVGAMTLASTSATGLFRLVADLYTLLGMVVIRLLVMFAPLIGVLGVVVAFGGVVRSAGNMLGAAVINTVGFSLAALVHTVATNALINGSGGGLEFGRLLLAALLTIGLLVVCWPLLSLRRIAGRDHRPGEGLLRKGGRMARSYVLTRNATAAGVREAAEDAPVGAHDRRFGQQQSDVVRPEARPRLQPAAAAQLAAATPLALTAEPVPSRRAGAGPDGGPVRVLGAATGRPALAAAPAEPAADRPADQDEPSANAPGIRRRSDDSVRPADIEAREVARRKAVERGLYVPSPGAREDVPRRVVTGRVMEPGEDPFARGPLHESNRRNGDAPGVVYVFDPATGRDVRLDDATAGPRSPVGVGVDADGPTR